MANEKRLIDANALLEKHTCDVYGAYDDSCMVQAVFVPYIKGAPTIDAVEVVHGKWIVTDADSGEPGSYAAYIEVNCSKCGYSLGAECGQYGWYLGDPFPLRYCPNCGAKMDGGISP